MCIVELKGNAVITFSQGKKYISGECTVFSPGKSWEFEDEKVFYV